MSNGFKDERLGYCWRRERTNGKCRGEPVSLAWPGYILVTRPLLRKEGRDIRAVGTVGLHTHPWSICQGIDCSTQHGHHPGPTDQARSCWALFAPIPCFHAAALNSLPRIERCLGRLFSMDALWAIPLPPRAMPTHNRESRFISFKAPDGGARRKSPSLSQSVFALLGNQKKKKKYHACFAPWPCHPCLDSPFLSLTRHTSSSYLTAETDPRPKEIPFLCTWFPLPSLRRLPLVRALRPRRSKKKKNEEHYNGILVHDYNDFPHQKFPSQDGTRTDELKWWNPCCCGPL